jgi:hypothetical protein
MKAKEFFRRTRNSIIAERYSHNTNDSFGAQIKRELGALDSEIDTLLASIQNNLFRAHAYRKLLVRLMAIGFAFLFAFVYSNWIPFRSILGINTAYAGNAERHLNYCICHMECTGPGGISIGCCPGFEECFPDHSFSISPAAVLCSLSGNNGWCRGTTTAHLAASDSDGGHTITISGDYDGNIFECDNLHSGDACETDLPEGAGTVTYSGSCSGGGSAGPSTMDWKQDSVPPAITYTY